MRSPAVCPWSTRVPHARVRARETGRARRARHGSATTKGCPSPCRHSGSFHSFVPMCPLARDRHRVRERPARTRRASHPRRAPRRDRPYGPGLLRGGGEARGGAHQARRGGFRPPGGDGHRDGPGRRRRVARRLGRVRRGLGPAHAAGGGALAAGRACRPRGAQKGGAVLVAFAVGALGTVAGTFAAYALVGGALGPHAGRSPPACARRTWAGRSTTPPQRRRWGWPPRPGAGCARRGHGRG